MNLVAYRIDHTRFSTVSAPRRIRPTMPVSSHSVGATSYPVPSIFPDEFSEYETYSMPNWDGYDAEPILPETVRAARSLNRLLPREAPEPDIAPGGDGTIGFEWYSAAEKRWTLVDVGPGELIKARRMYDTGRVTELGSTKVATGARALLEQLFS
jgi:hypothetical protein